MHSVSHLYLSFLLSHLFYFFGKIWPHEMIYMIKSKFSKKLYFSLCECAYMCFVLGDSQDLLLLSLFSVLQSLWNTARWSSIKFLSRIIFMKIPDFQPQYFPAGKQKSLMAHVYRVLRRGGRGGCAKQENSTYQKAGIPQQPSPICSSFRGIWYWLDN